MSFSFNSLDTNKILGFMLLVLAAAAMFLLPDLVFAAQPGGGSTGPGFFGPEQATVDATTSSLAAYWDAISGWMMWIGLAYLVVSILFWGGKMWWIAFIIWSLAAWGDSLVAWISTW